MLIKSVCTSVHEVLTTKVCCMQKIFTYSIMESITVWPTFCLIGLDWVFLKKIGQPRPLFRLFSVLSNKHYNFYNKQVCEKMSIQYTVLGFNPRPSEHKFPPITTRPGLPCVLYYYNVDCFGPIKTNPIGLVSDDSRPLVELHIEHLVDDNLLVVALNDVDVVGRRTTSVRWRGRRNSTSHAALVRRRS